MPATARKQRSTTVRIPRPLYEEARCLVREDEEIETVAELVTDSLREKLRALRKKMIDLQFKDMATDKKYQAEMGKISREFEGSDWEALRQTESKQH